MSRTTPNCPADQAGACNPDEQFLDELDARLRAVSEVLHSLRLLEPLVDPLTADRRSIAAMDVRNPSDWLRALNTTFCTRLQAAKDLVHEQRKRVAH
jgi:hypothetical protein